MEQSVLKKEKISMPKYIRVEDRGAPKVEIPQQPKSNPDSGGPNSDSNSSSSSLSKESPNVPQSSKPSDK